MVLLTKEQMAKFDETYQTLSDICDDREIAEGLRVQAARTRIQMAILRDQLVAVTPIQQTTSNSDEKPRGGNHAIMKTTRGNRCTKK